MKLPFDIIDLLEADGGGVHTPPRSLMSMEAIISVPHGPQQHFALVGYLLLTCLAVVPAPDAPL